MNIATRTTNKKEIIYETSGHDMENIKMIVVLYFICGYMIILATGDSDSNTTIIDGRNVDGDRLIEIGRRNNKPLLTLIGMAIRNIEQCLDWTQWTTCTAVQVGYFGTRNRTRTCYRDEHADNKTLNIETDVRICEGKEHCPSSYNLTDDGFCLKLYTVPKPWDNAEKLCQSDGGHLVFIDSEKKFSAAKKMSLGVRNYIYIDGRRKDANSPWMNVHGVTMTKFFWKPLQPNNQPTDLCMVLSNNDDRGWHDAPCTSTTYYLLCEIV